MLLNLIYAWLKQINYTQAVLVGGTLGIGFIVPQLWWLALLSVVWMIYALESAASTRKLIYLFLIIWGIKYLCSIMWFWSAYPIDWVAGMSTGVQITLISAYWLTSGLWLSSGGALFAVLSRWVLRKNHLARFILLLSLPFFWLLSEILAAVVFSVLTVGAGSFIQSYFSFGMIGYLLAVNPIGVWAAGVQGVYGLSVLFVGMGVVLYEIKKQLSLLKYLGVVVLSIIFVTFVPLPVPDDVVDTHTVITIDTQFDSGLLSSDAGYQLKGATLNTAVKAALALQPEMILLPEDSRYIESNLGDLNPQQLMSYWQFKTGNSNTVLIDSGRYTTVDGQTVLRAKVLDGVSGTLWQFDKQYLVPQGEYVPFAYGAVLRLLGYGAMVDAVALDSAYTPGPLQQTAELPDYIPGVLFCFESVNPRGSAALVRERKLPFIAHPISHGWFHQPKILWQQLDVMLQVQARYSGITIVSAGNMVEGKLYLPSGKIQLGEVIEKGERYTLRQFTF